MYYWPIVIGAGVVLIGLAIVVTFVVVKLVRR
jgi:hypothetical protein